jgi:hypothetical protein
MENSKQIEQYRNNLIDGIVRMREDGTLYILTRDKNGIQNCEIINPTNKPKVFGYFAKLPILDKRDKQNFIEVDLCSLYQQCFSSKKLPDSLQLSKTKENEQNKLMSVHHQHSLF